MSDPERANREAALQAAALAVSSAQGADIFRELTRALATVLGVETALIGRLTAKSPCTVETLGIYGSGTYRENIEYRLDVTPCRAVIAAGFTVVPCDLHRLFSEDLFLPAKAVAYAGYPLADADGRPAGVIGVFSSRPILDRGLYESVLKIFAVRAAAEIERRAHEADYRAIFEASEDAIFIHDSQSGAILDVNAKACSVYGYTREELRGMSVGDISGNEKPYTDAEAKRLIAAVREGGGPLRFEWRRRNKDGSEHWDEVTLKKVDIAGAPHVMAMTREITERKAAVEALRASEAQYRAIFNAAADAMVLRDARFRVVDVNPAYERMSGHRRAEVIGHDLLTMSPGEMNEHVKRLHQRALAGAPIAFESRARRKDGSRFDLEARGVPILHQGEPHVLYVSRDITARKTEEQLLRASEEQYRAIFDGSADALVLWDSELRRVDVNPAYERIYGYTREEALAPGYDERDRPMEYAERRRDLVRRTLAGERCQAELESVRKDGGRIQIEVRTIPIEYRGKPHVLAITRDVTERKRAEAAIRASEERYRLLFEMESDAIQMVDAETLEIIDMNPVAERLWGYSRAELLKMKVSELSAQPEETRAAIQEPTGTLTIPLRWHRRKDGSVFPIEITANRFELDGRRIVLAAIRDISERQRAEAAVRASEEQYRAIFNAAADALVLRDARARVIDVNPAFLAMSGYARGEVVNQTRWIFAVPEMEALGAEMHRRVIAGESVHFEIQGRRKDGALLDVEMRAVPIRYLGEQHALGMARDITERKRAEAAVRASEEQYRAIFNASVDGMLLWDAEHRVVDVNDAFLRMHGYRREEVLGQSEPLFIAEDLRGQCAGLLGKVLDGEPCRCESRGLRKDGSGFDVEMHGVRMHYQGRPHVLVILRDVTSRRQAEDRLRASEERYRLLYEMESDAIVLVDVETLHHLDVNRAAVELYGYSREELLALKSTDVSAEGDRTRSAMRSGATHDGFVRVPLRYHRKKDGTVFPVEITANFFDLHGRRIMLAAIRDITERKRAEEARGFLEAQLRQAQKMEAIGQLTGGVAHDFNNILQSILGNLTLAGEHAEERSDARLARYVERAQLSAQRARELIQQMLTFSRGRRGEPRVLSLAPLVAQAAKLLRPTLPSTIEVRLDLDEDAPAVRADPVQAEQVLLNLCINARDAMHGVGTLALAVRHARDARGVCASCRQRFSGDFVELAVRDNGTGIAPEIVDRMFEPFFSTKETGKGSGMGLSMVHGIVHEHGGHIALESAPGTGAAFRVLLPEADGAAAAEEKRVHAKAKPRLSGRVLVVDDEDMILELIGEVLSGWGIEVTLKASGVEAKHAFAAEPQRYDLVLTDHTMPRITGLELARQIRGIRPGTPVILYTGYGEDIGEDDLAAAGVRALARKPVEPAELFALLKTHLIQSRNTAK